MVSSFCACLRLKKKNYYKAGNVKSFMKRGGWVTEKQRLMRKSPFAEAVEKGQKHVIASVFQRSNLNDLSSEHEIASAKNASQ